MTDLEMRVFQLENNQKNLEQGQLEIKAALARNTQLTNESVELTKTSNAKIAEVITLFEGAKKGIKTAQWLGSAMKTMFVTVGVLLGAWMTFKKWLAGL